MLPEARINKEPSREFLRFPVRTLLWIPSDPYCLSKDHSDPFPSQGIPYPSQGIQVPPGSTTPAPFPGLPPQCTFLDSLARSPTRSIWIPALVCLGAKVEPLSPPLSSPASQALPHCPQGNPEVPLTGSLPSISQLRQGQGSHPQPAPTGGPCTRAGDVEMGRKASPSLTLGWKNQRGSIPEKWGGGLAQRGGDSGQWETETPRDQ